MATNTTNTAAVTGAEGPSVSCVTGVLPYATDAKSRRTYLPRGARPHLAWVGAEHGLGKRRALSGGALNGSLGLQQLLTVDAETGHRLALYRSSQRPTPLLSCPIPSGKAIAALLAQQSSGSTSSSMPEDMDMTLTDLTATASTATNTMLYASDVAGNIYHVSLGAQEAEEEVGALLPPASRRRTEAPAAPHSSSCRHYDGKSSADQQQWTLLTSAAALVPSTLSNLVVQEPSSASSSVVVQEWEGRAAQGGLSGWAGLASLHGSNDQLLSLREFYQDARVIDRETGRVLRGYSTTHPATGLHTPAAMPYCFLAAEGTLCTLFDTRCSSAVLTWEESIQPEAWRALSASAAETAADALPGEEKTIAPRPANGSSLVQQRLTSISGNVRDVCGTAEPMEVAMCIDRALCVFDLRKFTRVFTSSNVLKYDIASIAPLRGGQCIACVGIDSELRLVSLPDKAVLMAEKKDANKKNAAAPSKGEEGAADPNANLAGTFRTRLNSSVCCEQTWQGGWVTALNHNGQAAVGISITGELFLAQ